MNELIITLVFITKLNLIIRIRYIILLVMKKNKVSLGYWGLRGRGQIPRLLLAYTGELWEKISVG